MKKRLDGGTYTLKKLIEFVVKITTKVCVLYLKYIWQAIIITKLILFETVLFVDKKEKRIKFLENLIYLLNGVKQ